MPTSPHLSAGPSLTPSPSTPQQYPACTIEHRTAEVEARGRIAGAFAPAPMHPTREEGNGARQIICSFMIARFSFGTGLELQLGQQDRTDRTAPTWRRVSTMKNLCSGSNCAFVRKRRTKRQESVRETDWGLKKETVSQEHMIQNDRRACKVYLCSATR